MKLLIVIAFAIAVNVSSACFAQTEGPHLPGAVSKAPSWLTKDAPFDVAAYFKSVPAKQNAAPLYLDALLEFGPEVAKCFPDSPAIRQRRDAAQALLDKWRDLENRRFSKPESITDSEIDALLTAYEPGLRKIEEAQKRATCIFESGISFDTLLPHAQCARQVARVASVRAQRELARKNPAGALHDLEMVLRLSRDLQRRGLMISQLVSIAIDGVALQDAARIINDPNVSVDDCDRLMRILDKHESNRLESLNEGLKGEYLLQRTTLRDITGLTTDRGQSATDVQKETLQLLNQNFDPAQLGQVVEAFRKAPKEDAQWVIGELNRFYRDLLNIRSRKPYAERMKQEEALIASFKAPQPINSLRRVLPLMIVDAPPVDQAATRIEAMLRGTKCLVALKRWQLTHQNATPPNLVALLKEAKISKVPLDPYDGKPFKMVFIDSQAVCYSVGKDLIDDGGRVDWDNTRKPGDVLFKLKAN